MKLIRSACFQHAYFLTNPLESNSESADFPSCIEMVHWECTSFHLFEISMGWDLLNLWCIQITRLDKICMHKAKELVFKTTPIENHHVAGISGYYTTYCINISYPSLVSTGNPLLQATYPIQGVAHDISTRPHSHFIQQCSNLRVMRSSALTYWWKSNRSFINNTSNICGVFASRFYVFTYPRILMNRHGGPKLAQPAYHPIHHLNSWNKYIRTAPLSICDHG